MTATEAIQIANQLLRANADPRNALYRVLNERTVQAIGKLISVTTDIIYERKIAP